MAKAKRKRKPERAFAWVFLLIGLWCFFGMGRSAIYPLAVQKVSSVVCYEGTCSEYYVRRASLPKISKYGSSPRENRSYFVFENGLSVRILTSFLLNSGLSESELDAVVGTECTVYYADFPFFDGSYPLVAISNGENLEVSEEILTAAYREQAKMYYIALGVCVSLEALVWLIPWIWTYTKKLRKEKRKQEKRARRQMVLAARQTIENEKNLNKNGKQE